MVKPLMLMPEEVSQVTVIYHGTLMCLIVKLTPPPGDVSAEDN